MVIIGKTSTEDWKRPLLMMVSHVVRLLRFRYGFGRLCRGDCGIGQRTVSNRERELLLSATVAVVGADDALDEVVAYNVDVFEVAEADAFDTIEDVQGFEEA
jgi:hypothetical protein